MAHWLNDMSESDRQKAYALMRAVGADMDSFYNAPTQGGRGIPVGAGVFDDTIKAEVRRDYLAALRAGMTPWDACRDAQARALVYVNRHNAQRPKDVCWQRWTGHGADIAEGLARRFSDIAPAAAEESKT